MTKILNYILWPIISFALAYVFRDTPYDSNSKRITSKDFAIIKSSSFPDSLLQISNFLIQNTSSFPINSQNCLIIYSSDFLPQKAFITSASGITQTVQFKKDIREIFRISLPERFKNEDNFTVSVIYKSSQKVDDKLIFKVESGNDEQYINYGETNMPLSNVLMDFKKTQTVTKTIIIVETGLILYLIFFLLTRLTNWLILKYKQDRDSNFTQGGPNQFITAP